MQLTFMCCLTTIYKQTNRIRKYKTFKKGLNNMHYKSGVKNHTNDFSNLKNTKC